MMRQDETESPGILGCEKERLKEWTATEMWSPDEAIKGGEGWTRTVSPSILKRSALERERRRENRRSGEDIERKGGGEEGGDRGRESKVEEKREWC